MSEFLQYFVDQQDAMVDLLTTLVNHESFTQAKGEVDKLGAFMEGQFTGLGASSVTRIPQTEVGDFLLAKWNENAPGKPILFLIHIDTVWPIGTLAERPVTIDDDGRLFGPGAIDMKGGITIVLTAIRGLVERGEMPTHRPIWVLMTSDEEVGSIYSVSTIEEVAQQVGLALVMEPATQEGALKTWRKGLATFKVAIEGRASHAGNKPEEGINAVHEMAQQIVKISKLQDLKNGLSVAVNMVDGGIAGNVIAPHAEAHIDVRALTAYSLDETYDTIMGLTPMIPGSKVEVSLKHKRGPMERDEQMIATYGQCKRIGESIGVKVREDGSGGGSDGNLTASIGVATLDGLGPQGDGLHAVHEHVIVRSLPQRAALIAGMLRDWQFDGE